ncbi:MAG: peptide-methionine (R)-S-oxide reductase MsrB [Chthoniobacterales bacterium]
MAGGRITNQEKESLSVYVGVGVFVLLVLVGVFYFFFIGNKEVAQVTGFDPNRPVPTDEILRRRLGPDTYTVVREGRTERAFQNKYWNEVRPGIYVDIITGEPLFSSVDKYDAGIGVPSFAKPISNDLLAESIDTRFDMQRTQLQAKRSRAYLGHRFDDPNSPSGRRYSINSGALHFIPVEQMKAEGYEAYLPLVEKK